MSLLQLGAGLRERHDLLLQWFMPPYSSDLAAGGEGGSLFDGGWSRWLAGDRWASRRKIVSRELVGERWILDRPVPRITPALQKPTGPATSPAPKSFWRPSRCASNPLFVSGSSSRLCASLAIQLPVKILPVELPGRPWQFAIFTLKNRTVSPVVGRFIERVREFTRPMQGKKRGASAMK
jgi:hypothetical protein